jgi:hypothetical protein
MELSSKGTYELAQSPFIRGVNVLVVWVDAELHLAVRHYEVLRSQR